MKINFLSVVTPPPDIYHGCSTSKTFWEKKFTPVNMKSFGRLNVKKYRKIKEGDQYTALDISLKIYCMYKRKLISSQPIDYMGISGKGLETSMILMTKISNKKQKARLAITNITNLYFRKLLKGFNNSPYLGNKKKKIHNEPTEA